MEAFKRQASKFREQVSKHQQALLRQLGHFDDGAFVGDDAEIARRHQLQNLYSSTRAAKHFEKDIVHGVEGSISATSKEIEIDRRFAQDCSKYEADNHCTTSTLSETAVHLRDSRHSIIKEKEILLGVFGDQVCKPLRALIKSAELEDGRHLIRRYEKLWQEVEAQAAEVIKLRSKSSTEGPKSVDKSIIKLQLAEENLVELRSRLTSLGKEASSAMLSVEDQQQRITFQQLVVMVNAEVSFHRNTLTILEKLLTEMNEVEKQNASSPHAAAMQSQSHIPETQPANLNGTKDHIKEPEDMSFVAKVVHPFDGQAEGELSLAVDDIVIVHQVLPVGWAKGEFNGKTGWFPSPYVQKLDGASTGDITQDDPTEERHP